MLRGIFCVVASVLFAGLFINAAAKGPDFKNARVLEVSDASLTGADIAGREPISGKDPTAMVGAVVPRCLIKVVLDGKSYSAVFYEDKHFKQTDLAAGEQVPARVEGNKLVLKRPSDGKEMKAKIVQSGAVE
jgi:hypothetical protein